MLWTSLWAEGVIAIVIVKNGVMMRLSTQSAYVFHLHILGFWLRLLRHGAFLRMYSHYGHRGLASNDEEIDQEVDASGCGILLLQSALSISCLTPAEALVNAKFL